MWLVKDTLNWLSLDESPHVTSRCTEFLGKVDFSVHRPSTNIFHSVTSICQLKELGKQEVRLHFTLLERWPVPKESEDIPKVKGLPNRVFVNLTAFQRWHLLPLIANVSYPLSHEKEAIQVFPNVKGLFCLWLSLQGAFTHSPM